MKLKVFGTGSKGNAYALTDSKGNTLLIEAGMPIKLVKEYLDFDMSKIVGCLLSHSHGDHCKYVNKYLSAGIDVYMSEETSKEIENLNKQRVKILKPNLNVRLGKEFRIRPFLVEHDVECYGFQIYHKECGKIVFLTDAYYCKYLFQGLNNIIIEANYSEEILKEKIKAGKSNKHVRSRVIHSHMSLETCKYTLELNDLSKVNNIVLIHLSETNSNAEKFKKEISELTGKNVVVAENGLEMDFNKTSF